MEKITPDYRNDFTTLFLHVLTLLDFEVAGYRTSRGGTSRSLLGAVRPQYILLAFLLSADSPVSTRGNSE